MAYTVADLAKRVNGKVYGDGNKKITGVAGVETAGPNDIAFLLDEYAAQLPLVKAGAVLMTSAPEETVATTVIVTENPKWAFAELVDVLKPLYVPPVGIHPTAIVDETADIDPQATILPYVVIGAGTVVKAGAILHPHVVLGRDVTVGRDTEIHPGAVLHDRTEVGDRVIIRANAVIGGEGFGFATEDGKHTRIRQIGRVVIGDDVEVGAGTTIDNATFGETSIGRGTKIDNLVHLGHNVQIGEDCFIIAQVGVAGSTTIGNHCILAGQTGVSGHLTIADHVTCGGKTGVVGSIKEPGTYVGFPARPHRQWGRIEGTLNHLPELMKRVKRLEKALEKTTKE